MTDSAIAAILAGVATLLTTGGTVAVLVYTAIHKARQERDRSALEQYREVADRLQRHVEQRDAHIVELSEGFDQLSEEHSDCQVEVAELYGHLAFIHDFARRVARCCKKLGEDPGEVPPLPARRARPDRNNDAAEFRRRQLKQSTELLRSSSVTIPPPLPPHTPGGQKP